MQRLFFVLGFVAILAPQSAAAQPPAPATHSESPPTQLGAAVASALSAGGLKLTVRDAPLQFWYVKALPIRPGAAAPAWSDVEEGALVGAIRIDADFRDVRGRIIRPGVYTLRYGIQPENGDHLGVSPYREFALLIPAALDTEPAPRGHDDLVDLSKQTAGGSHPAVWSLDPPVTTADVGTRLTNDDMGLTSFVMEVPVTRDAIPAGTLRFGLVLLGKIEA